MKLHVAALALVTSVFAVCQAVLERAKRVGVADMITANSEDIAQRVQEGFLALLMQGSHRRRCDQARKGNRWALVNGCWTDPVSVRASRELSVKLHINLLDGSGALAGADRPILQISKLRLLSGLFNIDACGV